MRIGELLIECELITPKQLSTGLEYARAKGLPIGRVLKLLRYLEEDHLELALLAQRCIRGGLETPVVVSACKQAIKTGVTFEQALKKHQFAPVSLADETITSEALSNLAGKAWADVAKLGDDALNEDRLEDAELCYRTVVQQLDAMAEKKPIELADACSRLASFYLLVDRWAESEQLYMRALELRQKKLGVDDASIAKVYQDLADLYDVWDQYARSIQLALSACEVLNKHLPGSFNDFHGPLRKLTALCKKLPQAPRRRMGELLTETGMLSNEKLQVALQRGKQDNKPLGSVLRDEMLLKEQELQSLLSAQLLMKEGVLTEEVAVEALKVACKMNMSFRAVIDHFKLLTVATEDDELAEIVMEQDRLVSAENGIGVNHPEVGIIAVSLAEKYFARERLADAEVFFKRALAIDALTHALPPDTAILICEKLGSIYKSTGRDLLAVPLLLLGLELLSKNGQSESERGAAFLIMLAELEVRQQNYAVALSFLRSVNGLHEKWSVPDAQRIGVLSLLALCLAECDLIDEAEQIYTRLLAIAQQIYGPTDAETARMMERLADVHVSKGAIDSAKAHYYRCMQVYEYSLNADPGAVKLVAAKLAKLK